MGARGHKPAALQRESDTLPFVLEGGWGSQGQSGRILKISPSLAVEPRTVDLVTSCQFHFIRNENIKCVICSFLGNSPASEF